MIMIMIMMRDEDEDCFNYYSKPIVHVKVQQQNNTSVYFKHTYLYKLLSVIYISTNLISSG